jgi:hypothetical protein
MRGAERHAARRIATGKPNKPCLAKNATAPGANEEAICFLHEFRDEVVAFGYRRVSARPEQITRSANPAFA